MSDKLKGQAQPASGGFGGEIKPPPAAGGQAQRGKVKFEGTYTPPEPKPEDRPCDSD